MNSLNGKCGGGQLIIFRAARTEFWYEELDSVLTLYGSSLLKICGDVINSKRDIRFPYLLATFDDINQATVVAQRCTLVRFIVDLFAIDTCYEQIINKSIQAIKQSSLKSKFFDKDNTEPWRLDVSSFGIKISMQDQENKRKQFFSLKFTGPINLSNELTFKEVNVFLLYEHFVVDEATGSHVQNKLKTPELIFFGRVIGEGFQDEVQKYSLKSRQFLGPTSTESELAFLMANQVLAGKGKVVFDPFVGTGSLLISCSHFGAFTFGSDIDMRILQGKNSANAFTNFEQYKLPPPELFRMDFSPRGVCLRATSLFDAIVCDPPYGIRAGARKSGEDPRRKKATIPESNVAQRNGEDRIPKTQAYFPQDLLSDLVDLAARLLVVGGRLAYLLPVAVQSYNDEMLPRHPCLKLLSNCEDFISLKVSRRLVTMEKTCEYDLNRQSEYAASTNRARLMLGEKNILPGQDKQKIEEIDGKRVTRIDRRRMKKEAIRAEKKLRKLNKTKV